MVKGSVKGQGAELEFYNVTLLNASDSSLITGSAFSEVNFSLQASPAEGYILKVTSMGFLPVVKRVEASANLDVGLIVLAVETKELEAVTVKGKKASFTQKNGKLVMNIQGTTLSDAGTVFDALSRIPGLRVGTDDKVTLVDKGAPLIIVDGKEVRDNEELNRLQSNDIVSVEIDRNPSAKYDASVTSVLYIVTKKKKKDHLSLQLSGRSRNGLGLNVKQSYNPGIKVNFRKGRLSNYITYHYGEWNYKGNFSGHLTNKVGEYSYESNKRGLWNNGYKSQRAFWGSTYDLAKGGSLQAQYSFSDYSNEHNINTLLTLRDSDSEITRITDTKRHSDGRLHTLALVYEARIDSLNSLTFGTDYSVKDNVSRSDIFEGNVAYADRTRTRMRNDTEYSVASGKIDYRGELSGIGVQAGAKYLWTQNDGLAKSLDLEDGGVNFNNGNETLDQIFASYLLANKSVNKWSFSAGLRIERTKTNVKLNDRVLLDTVYVGWYPSASVSYALESEAKLSFTYSRKIQRPDFWSLNPSISYLDSLLYSQGDPTLSPASIDVCNLNFSLPLGLSLFAEYEYYRNSIMWTAINSPGTVGVVKRIPINLSKTEYLNFGANYNFSLDKLNLNSSVRVGVPFIKVPYMDGFRELRDPFCSVDIDGDYSLGKRFQLLAGFHYISRRMRDLTMYAEFWDSSLGLQAKFLDDKLLVTMRSKYIFSSDSFRWLGRYGTIEQGHNDKTNRRALIVYVRYNLNEFKNIFKDKSGGNDALRRL
ncbi:TonB-dependent receptor [Fulvitalea axinellae]|uniref:TonB-dependent receptor n=2 Tax=Fulvitalea axinellae TaxID=1182444 RepID=A0AAU9CKF0_9BACT|nr:TonB-dependent receptor [Fulvitalea axinellae]